MDFSAGQLAKAAQRSKESAKGWKRGNYCPNGASLINMARQLPEVRSWLIAEIAQGDETFEFDSPRALHEINRKLSQLLGRNDNG